MKKITFYSAPEFYGTENYYTHPLFKNVLYTDGVQATCEKLRCYWLLDIVMSYCYKVKEGEFAVASFVLYENSGGIFTLSEDMSEGIPMGKIHATQEVLSTDLEHNMKFYVQTAGGKTVIMLPSEY